MNLRDLSYLIAVADTKHFGKAAERCFVSQPTLSGQIKKLEDELGVTLFERTKRSVAITPVGEEILILAKRVMEQADAIQQLARAHNNPLAGPLRVGAIPTISPYLMPLILMPMKEQHPEMRLVLTEDITDNLLQRLHDHQIDAAILATPVLEPELDTIPLFDEPFWLAHPTDHELYAKDAITRKDLDNLDLLLLTEGHCLTHQVMEVCHVNEQRAGSDMADLRASSLETLLQLVSAGYGSTLVPALAIRGSWTTGSGIIVRELDVKDAQRRVLLAYRKTFPREAALTALVDIIKSRLPNTVQIIDEGPRKKRRHA